MKKILLTLVFIFSLLLTGCGYGKLTGTIAEKKYTPSSVSTQMVYTGKTWVYIPRKVKEKWSVKLVKEESRRNKIDLDNCI